MAFAPNSSGAFSYFDPPSEDLVARKCCLVIPGFVKENFCETCESYTLQTRFVSSLRRWKKSIAIGLELTKSNRKFLIRFVVHLVDEMLTLRNGGGQKSIFSLFVC